ncbi:MAG: isocitrate dehydrogenase (NAD(+)) [Halanaerobiales bacterium]|nr:isocitrate dehydrogenase (NAD(+)) [Halanaerobiales bacterium]
MYNITLLPGDGIGPEVTEAAKKVINATGIKVNWHIVNCGEKALEEFGKLVPDELYQSIEEDKIVLKGPITTPVGYGFRSINVALRQKYDLYANVRPVKNIPGIQTPFKDVDLVIVRENTEGLYSGKEHIVTDGVTESLKIITEKASLRIAKFAFEYAINNERKKVTVVHKANIMKISDGLFLDCARKVASIYPDIEFEEVIVDNMCMQLVMNPQKYDVLVMPNLYGDLLSDLSAGLVGGLGVVPGANIGDKLSIFESVHGSAPDIAGKNVANPTACILSGAMMLDYLGEKDRAKLIINSLFDVINEGKFITKDLGGLATTSDMTSSIIEGILQKL